MFPGSLWPVQLGVPSASLLYRGEPVVPKGCWEALKAEIGKLCRPPSLLCQSPQGSPSCRGIPAAGFLQLPKPLPGRGLPPPCTAF